MKKILVGAARSKGEIREGGRKIKYDNIKLYLVDYNDFKTHGFSVPKNFEPVKIKTADFLEISGISPKEFLLNFENVYMFRKCRVIGEENEFDRFEVTELQLSDKNCFALFQELKAKEEEAVLNRLVDKDDDFDEDDEDEDFDEFEGLEVNKKTGEVK